MPLSTSPTGRRRPRAVQAFSSFPSTVSSTSTSPTTRLRISSLCLLRNDVLQKTGAATTPTAPDQLIWNPCSTSITRSAFVLSAPALLAVATVSLIALRKLVPNDHPLLQSLRLGRRRCRSSVLRLAVHSRRMLRNGIYTLSAPGFSSSPATASARTRSPEDDDGTTLLERRLDDLRDRAVAQLDNERINSFGDSASVMSADDFAAMPALQKRELLASTFAAGYKEEQEGYGLTSSSPPLSGGVRTGAVFGGVGRLGNDVTASTFGATAWRAPTQRSGNGETNGDANAPWTAETYWRVAESVNGRAAALGFVLCLAREIIEPGHPSLFEQVVDVVVPIAQSTPPFLVAVCDRIADLLT